MSPHILVLARSNGYDNIRPIVDEIIAELNLLNSLLICWKIRILLNECMNNRYRLGAFPLQNEKIP
jgi:hypothetical protein